MHDLICSFELERPSAPVGPPSWDLVKVLEYLPGPVFEPLSSKPLRVITVKTLFLLALATAKRVGELQALSHCVVSQGLDIYVLYLPEFVAKTKSERNPLPRSFFVKSLSEFVGDLPKERLLCPVNAVLIYLDTTSSLTPRPQSLFVSPHCPSHALSKNALSFFLRQVISDVGAIFCWSSQGSQCPRCRNFSVFLAQLVGLQGARGGNLAVESSLLLILF